MATWCNFFAVKLHLASFKLVWNPRDIAATNCTETCALFTSAILKLQFKPKHTRGLQSRHTSSNCTYVDVWVTPIDLLLTIHKSCSDKCFPPFCRWNVPNCKVLRLRMGRNAQMEQSILIIQMYQSNWKSSPPQNFDRNFWSFWLNGSCPCFFFLLTYNLTHSYNCPQNPRGPFDLFNRSHGNWVHIFIGHPACQLPASQVQKERVTGEVPGDSGGTYVGGASCKDQDDSSVGMLQD